MSSHCVADSFFAVCKMDEMQKRVSAREPGLSKTGRQQETGIRKIEAGENVQVFLEVEVTESIYAAISGEKGHPVENGGVVEVTIIRPENVEASSTDEVPSKKMRNSCPEKLFRREVTSASERRFIPRLDNRQNKSFTVENPVEGPSINIGEIVGDLPSRLRLNPRAIESRTSLIQVRHGDHCHRPTSGADISRPKIDGGTAIARNNMQKTLPCVNSLVYHHRLDEDTAVGTHRRKCPLVEINAARKIFETYSMEDKHNDFDIIQKTLTEWGSDEERISDMLTNETSGLTRCEHCGIVSLKRGKISVSRSVEQFSGSTGEHSLTRTTNTYDGNVDTVTSCDQMSREKSKASNTESKKYSKSSTEDEIRREQISPEVKKFTTSENCGTPLAPDGLTKGEDDFMFENVKFADVSQKKLLQNISVAHNLSQQIIANIVGVPNRNLPIPDRNESIIDVKQGKNSSLFSKYPNAVNVPVHNNSHLSMDTGNKKSKLSIFSTNILTKLEKQSSIRTSERSAIDEKKSLPLQWKNKHAAVPLKSDKTETLLNTDHRRACKNRALLSEDVQEGLQFDYENSSDPGESLVRPCADSSDDQLSTDCECSGNNQFRYNCNDQRSLRSARNGKSREISASMNCDYNYSAPSICFARGTLAGNNDFVPDNHLADNNSHSQCNEESETTAFTSSSSENVIRRLWADSLAQLPRIECNDESSFDAIRSIREQINRAIESCVDYTIVSEDKLYDHVSSSKSHHNIVPSDTDFIAKQFQRFKNTNYPHFPIQKVTLPTNSVETDRCQVGNNKDCCTASRLDSKMKESQCETSDSKEMLPADDEFKLMTGFTENTINVLDERRKLNIAHDKRCRDIANNDRLQTTDTCEHKNIRNNVKLVENVTACEKPVKEKSGASPSQKNFYTSKGSFSSMNNKDKAVTSMKQTKVFDEFPKNSLQMTYKNPITVTSSCSECSGEDQRELDIRKRSSFSRRLESVLQLRESEKFERQIAYDEISSREISSDSKENLEAKALPMYRKILESKDEMDWEDFQQLVGTLHPSQRELWSDICKAVSNEARRISGETGASTEVCIEINPVLTSQMIRCEERSRVKTSENELSFEIDMVLSDSETPVNQQSNCSRETSYEYEKCEEIPRI